MGTSLISCLVWDLCLFWWLCRGWRTIKPAILTPLSHQSQRALSSSANAWLVHHLQKDLQVWPTSPRQTHPYGSVMSVSGSFPELMVLTLYNFFTLPWQWARFASIVWFPFSFLCWSDEPCWSDYLLPPIPEPATWWALCHSIALKYISAFCERWPFIAFLAFLQLEELLTWPTVLHLCSTAAEGGMEPKFKGSSMNESVQQDWCALNVQNQVLCLYSIRGATYQTNLKSKNTCVYS